MTRHVRGGAFRATGRRDFALAAALAFSCAFAFAGCGGGDGGDREARGARGSAAGARPNIVLITIDTFRADHLHAAGYARETTPVIDSLAAAGALFTQAISQAPETAPSHASILTGAYPPAHAVRSNGTFALPEEMTTIAEMLRDAGYQTGAFVGAFVLDSKFGFAQGFDAYDDSMDAGAATALHDATAWYGNVIEGGFERRASSVTDAALRWLGARTPGPFFMWVHYYDPHAPYDPPKEHDIFPKHDPAATYAQWEAMSAEGGAAPIPHREDGGAGEEGAVQSEVPAERSELLEDMVALYDGEIRACDAQVGRIADALRARGAASNTLVIVTSDHGESLVENEYYFRHGWYLHDNVLRVPLVVSGAGVANAGAVVHEQVELIDVFATMADAAAVEAPLVAHMSENLRAAIANAHESGDGTSSAGAASGRGAARAGGRDDLAYSETFLRKQLISGPPLFSVRSPAWKYIEPVHEEGRTRRWLYDLAIDPHEGRNLAKEGPENAARADSLRGALRAILAATENAALADANRVEPDEATIERLRALGYIK
ncbi:MAG: sulfatase [bacterium]